MPNLAPAPSQVQFVDSVAELQAEIDSLRAELDHNQRLATLGTLAAGIAHEINNILTPVLAYAQLAAAHPEDQALQAKVAEKSVTGVHAAAQITQAMLGFARTADESDETDVLRTFQQALDCIGCDLSKNRIAVNVKVQSGCIVRMRPLALQQVFINLILNARTAMARRGGRLTIQATPCGNGQVSLEISDTGPGIPKQIAGRLFQPFVSTNISRRAATAAGQKQGTGLGLAICRRLVEEAGGTIIARSQPEQGATFIINLASASQKLANAG
jgi:two-component system, NtrC family, sensor kinase